MVFLFPFPQRVFALINMAFKKIYEDHVQMADWAQKTIGNDTPSAYVLAE